MADAGDSKSPVLTGVQVRLLSPAPIRLMDLRLRLQLDLPGQARPDRRVPWIEVVRIQRMKARTEALTERSCGAPIPPMTLRITAAITLTAPPRPRAADCSTMNPALDRFKD